MHSLRDIQQQADAWISQFKEGYFPPLVQIARLVEELGELSRAVSHEQKVKKPKPGESCHAVKEELGDLLFVLVCFANAQNIDLDEAFSQTMQKIIDRDTSRWTLKDSYKNKNIDSGSSKADACKTTTPSAQASQTQQIKTFQQRTANHEKNKKT